MTSKRFARTVFRPRCEYPRVRAALFLLLLAAVAGCVTAHLRPWDRDLLVRRRRRATRTTTSISARRARRADSRWEAAAADAIAGFRDTTIAHVLVTSNNTTEVDTRRLTANVVRP